MMSANMDWRSNPQYTPKRKSYVKGIADQLQISMEEAANLEQQVWNSAPTLSEYPHILKSKAEERKMQRQQSLQQQHHHSQMYSANQVQGAANMIRVPTYQMRAPVISHQMQRLNNPGNPGIDVSHHASRMPMMQNAQNVVHPHVMTGVHMSGQGQMGQQGSVLGPNQQQAQQQVSGVMVTSAGMAQGMSHSPMMASPSGMGNVMSNQHRASSTGSPMDSSQIQVSVMSNQMGASYMGGVSNSTGVSMNPAYSHSVGGALQSHPSPSGLNMTAYSPHAISSSAAGITHVAHPSPVAPVESPQQYHQQPQQATSSNQQVPEPSSDKLDKMRHSILKFTAVAAKLLSTLENNPNLWTPVVQKIFECGRGGMSRLNQLSPAELELYTREIKAFHQRYSKHKTPSISEKVIRAVNEIMPMPCVNYDLKTVFDEPKRIARGSLIQCPAKRSRVDIDSFLISETQDDANDGGRLEELKMQLQKEIAINSDNFDIKFADSSSYECDPIVFNCCLRDERLARNVGLLQVKVYCNYPDDLVDCEILMKGDRSEEKDSTGDQNKQHQSFYSTLNPTQTCSFSHVLNKYLAFSKQCTVEL